MTDEDERAFYDTAKNNDAYLVTGNTRHYPNESFILTPTEFIGLWTKPIAENATGFVHQASFWIVHFRVLYIYLL